MPRNDHCRRVTWITRGDLSSLDGGWQTDAATSGDASSAAEAGPAELDAGRASRESRRRAVGIPRALPTIARFRDTDQARAEVSAAGSNEAGPRRTGRITADRGGDVCRVRLDALVSLRSARILVMRCAARLVGLALFWFIPLTYARAAVAILAFALAAHIHAPELIQDNRRLLGLLVALFLALVVLVLTVLGLAG